MPPSVNTPLLVDREMQVRKIGYLESLRGLAAAQVLFLHFSRGLSNSHKTKRSQT